MKKTFKIKANWNTKLKDSQTLKIDMCFLRGQIALLIYSHNFQFDALDKKMM